MANGETISRSIGFAIIRDGKALTTDEVVFGEAGDLQLLGARTLEGLNLRVDSRNREALAAGPLIAAGNVEPGDDQWPLRRTPDGSAPVSSATGAVESSTFAWIDSL